MENQKIVSQVESRSTMQWKRDVSGVFIFSWKILLLLSHKTFSINHLSFRLGQQVCVQAWLSVASRSVRWRVWWWSSCWCLYFVGCPSSLPTLSTCFTSSLRPTLHFTSSWSPSPTSTPAPTRSSTAFFLTTSGRASRRCSASTNQMVLALQASWELDGLHQRKTTILFSHPHRMENCRAFRYANSIHVIHLISEWRQMHVTTFYESILKLKKKGGNRGQHNYCASVFVILLW